jgi:radical SAM protein with 4Fe4S-binding SPASM domain
VAEVIISKQNEEHLQKISDFATNQIGVDGVFYKSLCFPLHSKGFRDANDKYQLIKKYLPEKSPITRYVLNNEKLALKNPKETCDWHQKSLILWDGRVAACCYDYNGEYTFGNINENSFLDIWNSKKYRYYREKLIKYKKLELCEYCSIV